MLGEEMVRRETELHVSKLTISYQGWVNANVGALRKLIEAQSGISAREGYRHGDKDLTFSRNPSQVGTSLSPTFISVQLLSSSFSACIKYRADIGLDQHVSCPLYTLEALTVREEVSSML
jgi:hypothetical protein